MDITKKDLMVKLLFDIQSLQLERLQYLLFVKSMPPISLVTPNFDKITSNRTAILKGEEKLYKITKSLTATLKRTEDLQNDVDAMDFIEFNITCLQTAKIAHRSQLDYQATLCEEIKTLMGVPNG